MLRICMPFSAGGQRAAHAREVTLTTSVASTGSAYPTVGGSKERNNGEAAGSKHDVRCRQASMEVQQENGVGGMVQQSSGQQRVTAQHQQRCGAINEGTAAVEQQ